MKCFYLIKGSNEMIKVFQFIVRIIVIYQKVSDYWNCYITVSNIVRYYKLTFSR